MLEWTYQDQAADAVARRESALAAPAGARSCLVAVERQGMLGVRIDCAGAGMMHAPGAHPDAEAVHEALCRLKPLWIGLLIDYGKSGAAPDWMPGATPRPEPILRSNGKPQVEYYDRPACRRPAYCPLRYNPEPEHLAFAREIYAEWWSALAALAESLPVLAMHEVTGPSAPRAPWL
ncbi:MAG: hypothetical protein QNJ84_11850 [Alphaproteobacteria bacterium]|nr:hypothetical protein [Alphaproteobacteria bacterium]